MQHSDTVVEPRLHWLFRAIGVIERAGNKLPHPFWLFWILSAILGVLSLTLAALDVSATLPNSGEVVAVKNLLSLNGLAFAASSALDNFAGFPPLTIIIVVLLGVSVAEKSGFLTALLRMTVIRLPKRLITFATAFAAMTAHVMSDTAYLVMIPLGALAFRAAGRSPVLGVMVAYVSTAVGFNASPLVTPGDGIRTGLTTAAAQIVDPHYVVTPVALYFFSAVSSVFLAMIITLVVETLLAKRPDVNDDVSHSDDAEQQQLTLSPTERRALRYSGLVFALFVALVITLMAIPGSPLLGKGGGIVNSVVVKNISVFLSLLFACVGLTYGRLTGSLPTLSDLPAAMIDGIRQIAPVIVLFFAVSQFLAYFEWSGIGSLITVGGADLLQSVEAPHWVILLLIVLAISILNMVITSGSAAWSILAPVLIPMMMYIQMPPELAMVGFQIGDSVTNPVSPMNAYFVMALGFVQQYRKNAGIGTLMSFTVPIALAILVAWTAFFMLWYALGIPLGPGVHIR
ncbi:p-aminobenzoyl-glutamate transporter [Streptomyces sp. WAC 06783]|uniref:AbgT family transporter n=1 Tax=Streptomyces sp. WAC 06783 TaxID=2203211 RepID=UPI000F73BF41|nr:AbgT family transporter [Streptomyces sp. WAC 06783]RSO05661.1 p-aminobenzoyl-glutamate transporter [Streptomyces sp. WAC 06783]